MKFSTSAVSAGVLLGRIAAAATTNAGGSSIERLSVGSEDEIKASAKQVAANVLTFYHGDDKGKIPGVIDPPYYWWNGAAVFSSLIEYWHFTGDSSRNDLVMRGMLHQAGDHRDYLPINFTNAMSNDDNGIWGMTAMLAAERKFPDPPRDQPQWIELAQNVFDGLASRWDDKTCDGGLRWLFYSFQSGYNYKNSMSTGVLLNLGARLYSYTGNSTFGDWASKSWDWAEKTGLITKDGAVLDGVDTENCTHVRKIEFSYVSGVYILSAAHMYSVTKDSKWKDRVDTLVKHAMKNFFNGDAVYEPSCTPSDTCGQDMLFFTGIFIQTLVEASQVAPHIAQQVKQAVQGAAEQAVKLCSGDNDMCGPSSSSGSDKTEKWILGIQTSVLSNLSPLLAKSDDKPATAKTGTSTGSSSGNSTGGDDKGNGSGSKDGKGSGDKKAGAASSMASNVVLGLVMACATALLL